MKRGTVLGVCLQGHLPVIAQKVTLQQGPNLWPQTPPASSPLVFVVKREVQKVMYFSHFLKMSCLHCLQGQNCAEV